MIQKNKMNKQLTKDEQVYGFYTYQHISRVRDLIGMIVSQLLIRAKQHDQSKLKSPEIEIFAENQPLLQTNQYGSEEYHKVRQNMGPALDHHYENNSHHPEFYPEGISGMNLVDLIEMLCDWKAASEQHGGNIHKSLKINIDRYNISPELSNILKNTIELLHSV